MNPLIPSVIGFQNTHTHTHTIFFARFGFFVQRHINRRKLFHAKFILQEEHLWYYLTYSWKDKGVHTFPKGISPKVNVVAQLEFELANYDSAVHRLNHYTTRNENFVCVCVCVCVYVTAIYESQFLRGPLTIKWLHIGLGGKSVK